MKRLDIIIPTYLGSEELIHLTKCCFKSLKECTKFPFRIFWIDNGTDDKIHKKLKEYSKTIDLPIQLDFHDSKPLGFVRAINEGINAILAYEDRPSHICFLNNDTIVTPKWAKMLIEDLKDFDIIAPFPTPDNWRINQQEAHEFKTGEDWTPLKWDYEKEKKKLWNLVARYEKVPPQKTEMVNFSSVIFKTEVIERLGLLNTEFGDGLFDDDDYCWRAREEGFKIGYSLQAYIHHFGSQTFDFVGIPKKRLLYLENWAKFKELHPTWKKHLRYQRTDENLCKYAKELNLEYK